MLHEPTGRVSQWLAKVPRDGGCWPRPVTQRSSWAETHRGRAVLVGGRPGAHGTRPVMSVSRPSTLQDLGVSSGERRTMMIDDAGEVAPGRSGS